MRTRRLRRGATLVESVTAATLTVLVLGGAISTFLQGMRTWVEGQSKLDAEQNSQQVVRAMDAQLREAMFVQVAGDGMSLTYRLPAKNGDGEYSIPPVWDNVTRQLYIVPGTGGFYSLYMGPNGSARLMSKRVILTDPEAPGNPAYTPFQASQGTVSREVTVRIITKSVADSTNISYSRTRERVVIRNVPATTR